MSSAWTRATSNEGMLAYHDDVNLMKGAIMASNFVTTVSPTYAYELTIPFYAHGMDGVINQQRGKVQGILNGIDMDLYDPANGKGLAEASPPTRWTRARRPASWPCRRRWACRRTPMCPLSPVSPAWWATRLLPGHRCAPPDHGHERAGWCGWHRRLAV